MSISKDLFPGGEDSRSPSFDAIKTDHAYAFFRALRQSLNEYRVFGGLASDPEADE